MNAVRRGFLALLAAAFAAAGGVGCPSGEAGPQPLGGYRFKTELGFEVWWTLGTPRYPTPAAACLEVDRLFEELAAALGGSREEHLGALSAYPIQLLPSQAVPGDDLEADLAEFVWYGWKIDLALEAGRWDCWLGRPLVGLEWLLHAWRHARLGEWHPAGGCA